MTNSISHDSEVPAHGEQVITACAFIHHRFDDTEKLFSPQRALTKKFLPGVYELPGGHIDFGESLEAGLKREVLEEFGMDITVGDPFAAFTYVNDIKGSHSVEIIYFARFVDPIEHIQLNPEDHATFVWIGSDEIDTIISKEKGMDDPEIQAIQKGFALLQGGSLQY